MELVTRHSDKIPEDVCIYIRELFERNVVRNDRLAAQLAEIAGALNDHGVTPILLKGAITLAIAPRAVQGLKLMSDLDIMVSPDEVDSSLQALLGLGYAVHHQSDPNAGNYWHIDLKRPSDVGMIDLHRAPPGPAFFYPPGDPRQHCTKTPLGRGSVYIPSATYRALMLIMHDQFQDSDYWIGNIDIRHLVELRDLANSPEGIDWNLLTSFTQNKLARNALETHLVALFSLFGVEVPAGMRTRFIPRLQHWRRLVQARVPMLRYLLLPIAVMDYRNYRRGLGASFGQLAGVENRSWRLPKRGTLNFLFSLCRSQRVGKI